MKIYPYAPIVWRCLHGCASCLAAWQIFHVSRDKGAYAVAALPGFHGVFSSLDVLLRHFLLANDPFSAVRAPIRAGTNLGASYSPWAQTNLQPRLSNRRPGASASGQSHRILEAFFVVGNGGHGRGVSTASMGIETRAHVDSVRRV